MVINHLLNGMILQVMGLYLDLPVWALNDCLTTGLRTAPRRGPEGAGMNTFKFLWSPTCSNNLEPSLYIDSSISWPTCHTWRRCSNMETFFQKKQTFPPSSMITWKSPLLSNQSKLIDDHRCSLKEKWLLFPVHPSWDLAPEEAPWWRLQALTLT